MTSRVRVPYQHLTVDERAEVSAWFDAHGIDSHRVPLDSDTDLCNVTYDATTDEWRIEVYVLRNGNKYFEDEAAGAVRRTVRRAARAPFPWPTMPAPDPAPIVATAADVSGKVLLCPTGQAAAARAYLAARGDTATQVLESRICPAGQYVEVNVQAQQQYLKEALTAVPFFHDPEPLFARDAAAMRAQWIMEVTLRRPRAPLVTGLGT